MASRSVSPGGALLRASRVFSIPAPLPRPMGDLSATAIFNSDTATLPHPTHLSITTPPSSRARGDWGFKRPLPLRSTTKTSTPFIRVEAIDTFEHITEFGSSADHALTLQKWQEMGVPLTIGVKKNTGSYESEYRKSVFEDEIDSTTEPADQFSLTDNARWNYKGPWLAGMTNGDFNAYVTKQVNDKKSDFRKFLRVACARSLTTEARRKAVGEEEPPAAVQPEDVTEDQMTEYVKVLRYDRAELYKLIRVFLDLPPPPQVKAEVYQRMIASMLDKAPEANGSLVPDLPHAPVSVSPYTDSGPPKTHPSAGLAYGLTNAHVYNHPKFGPQSHKSPVKARVVLPRAGGVGNFGAALGVGGFVTAVPSQFGGEGFNRSNLPGAKRTQAAHNALLTLDPNKEGGSKAYVEPSHAQVNPSGKVILTIKPADAEAVAVHEGTTDQIQPTPTISKNSWKVPGLNEAAQAGSIYSSSYGSYGLRGRKGAKAEETLAKQASADVASREMENLLKVEEEPM
ncbi:uncharacterized protein PAC_14659 [Phialocephala subalpina]|uniref:Uncharacterized protein n=1 Tax=Phialocephala subalpina TaxID=576137 RepID=A0A1L7XI99_9HELO|nr:uncharacterized protein PAC_14659 [Phialocephala subalpina]